MSENVQQIVEKHVNGYTSIHVPEGCSRFGFRFFLAHLIKAWLWFKHKTTMVGKGIIGLVLSNSKTTGETISNNEKADVQLDVGRSVGDDLMALSETKQPCLITQSKGANPIWVPTASSSIQNMAAKLPPASFQKEATTSAESLHAEDLPSSCDLNKAHLAIISKPRGHEKQNSDLKNLTGIKERTPDSKASHLLSSSMGAVRASRTIETDQCITSAAKDKGFEHQTRIAETPSVHPRTIPSCSPPVTNDPADSSGSVLVQCCSFLFNDGFFFKAVVSYSKLGSCLMQQFLESFVDVVEFLDADVYKQKEQNARPELGPCFYLVLAGHSLRDVVLRLMSQIYHL
ncbi:unnamed protein product [Cuscuta campestris]|uniref:Uncharacterized protein n=1 Tax=Cuscuta campestris TaxID=132261 RepID=A0A484LTC6_9ASTE|nr:unnamed protein product [Cuscuta campestris]